MSDSADHETSIVDQAMPAVQVDAALSRQRRLAEIARRGVVDLRMPCGSS